MQNKLIIYLGIFGAIIVIFMAGFYVASFFKKPLELGEKPVEEIGYLKSLGAPFVLHGFVIKIDREKTPMEIIVSVNLVGNFENPPSPSITRKFLIDDQTLIFTGKSGPDEPLTPANVDVLEEKSPIIVTVSEDITEILNRETFSVLRMKVIKE
ncbi:MAG: hypothetical protein NT012_01235 [Candidatus Nealsonbacteria bacterium]|nr:hypothetical protein [Candidatus Nealsonbacteria bacterium]